MKMVVLVGGQKILTHEKKDCRGESCCIHNPSDHHMKDWPQFWRDDKGMMERICQHGVAHPDPDDIAFQLGDIGNEEASWVKLHGCDGCCRE